MARRISNDVDTVHVVFKTHLDLGYTDLASNIRDHFFQSYIPNAVRLAKSIREEGEADKLDSANRFVWTTGSWLVYEYLEWAKGRARKEAEEAILAGDLAYHGIPFTFHSELCEPSHFRYGLKLAERLDQRFGRKTISAKMTDVPGHTRGIIPLLADAGIRFLHLGKNEACKAPKVPPAFRWRHTDGSEIVVLYQHVYGATAVIDGMDSALVFEHGEDNHPPPDAAAIHATLSSIRKKYPEANVNGSSMEPFAESIWAFRENLPVVEGELADSWIHGVGSAPEKTARYLALARLRRKWIEQGRFDDNKPSHDLFSRTLLCVPEHTWGLRIDELEDNTSYDGHALKALRRSKRGKRQEYSWDEQVQYTRDAVAALGKTELRAEAEAALAELQPRQPNLSTPGIRFAVAWEAISTPRFDLNIGPGGEIEGLVDKETGRTWSDHGHPLFQFGFENFSRADFDRFLRQYNPRPIKCAWGPEVMSKFGMDAESEIQHGWWEPTLDEVYIDSGTAETRVIVSMSMPEEAVRRFGCPTKLSTELLLGDVDGTIEVIFQWSDMYACRFPTASWLGFNPIVSDSKSWMMLKAGSWISPLEVVQYGNRKLHAVQELRADASGENEGGLRVIPLDSPLVAPGGPSLTDFNQHQPDLRKGFHFNLWNNIWNTNFPMWQEGDCKFRFRLELPG